MSPDDALDLERAFEDGLAGAPRLAFRVAYGVLRQRQDAEDVAQEAILRAHQRVRSLREGGRLRAWLVRVAWRLALDHRRAAQRRARREQCVADPPRERDAEELASASEFRARLFAAIDALPEKLRLAVMLGGIQGHDTRAVAELLGIPEGTVKSRLHLARRRLQEELG